MANRTRVRAEWVDSEIFEREDPAAYLEDFHAILVPGGFGERGTEGMIKAAQFAREKKVPYLGICLGMQMAVIEATRNLAGVTDAGSEEFDHEAGAKRFTPVVYHLKEWVQGNHIVTRKAGDAKGGTMRLGAYTANLKAGSASPAVYGTTVIEERHRHRYEVDIQLPRQAGSQCGLIFSGMSPDGKLPEIVEVKDHPWFIGVQFHPELKSQTLRPASAVRGFRPGGDGGGAVGVINKNIGLVQDRYLARRLGHTPAKPIGPRRPPQPPRRSSIGAAV